MKGFLLFFITGLSLSGCELFIPGDSPPNHDVRTFGSYIKKVENDYNIFSSGDCPVPYSEIRDNDSLTVDGQLYPRIFFVKIIPEKLKTKNYKKLGKPSSCFIREIYSKGDTIRKEMPGFGNRKFLVVENVVGIQ